MSSKLSGLLALGSINKLALCKCQSVGVSSVFSLPLAQKGSVLCLWQLPHSLLGQTQVCSLTGLCFQPCCRASTAGLHTGLCLPRALPAAIKAQPSLEQNTLLGSNFFLLLLGQKSNLLYFPIVHLSKARKNRKPLYSSVESLLGRSDVHKLAVPPNLPNVDST